MTRNINFVFRNHIFVALLNTIIRHIAAGYLAFIILLRMMAMPISLIDYSLNRSFILSNLCENRLKPEIHCAGTCFLKKQLAKTNDNQPASDQKGGGKNPVVDFFEPPYQPSFSCTGAVTRYSARYQTPDISSQYTGNLFRPPII